MKELKIAFLTTSFPEKGREHDAPFAKYLFNALKDINDDPVVVMPRGFKLLKKEGGLLPSLKKSFYSKILFIFYTLKFAYLIAKESKKCDVIHANWAYTAFLAILTKWYHGKKIILTSRSSKLIYTKNAILKRIMNFVYNHVDFLAIISNEVMKEVKHMYNIKHDNVTNVPNGVSLFKIKQGKKELRRKFGVDEKKFIFLYVGRIIKGKGVHILLEAYESLKDKRHDGTQLYLIGEGEELEELKEYVKSKGMGDRVIFLGNKKPQTVQEYMKLSNAVVFPSLYHTDGNVVIEASAMGVPLVSTDVVWGKILVKHGVTGYVVGKGDKEALGSCMNKIISKGNEFETNSKIVAKKFREEYTWKKTAEKYHRLYEKAIGCS